MSERVQTGGMMSFDYRRGRKLKLDEKRRREIEKGYGEYKERKKIEKRNFLIGWGIIILLIIILLVYFILR